MIKTPWKNLILKCHKIKQTKYRVGRLYLPLATQESLDADAECVSGDRGAQEWFALNARPVYIKPLQKKKNELKKGDWILL